MAIEAPGIIFRVSVEGQEKIEQVDKAVDNLEKKATKTKGAYFGMGNAISTASDEIRNKIQGTFPGAANVISAAGNAMGNVARNMDTATRATGLTSKALQFLKVAFISTGVGAIVVAIGTAISSMLSYLSQLAPVVDKAQQVFAGLGAAANTLGERMYQVAGGIKSIITLDFSEGFSKIKKAFTGLGKDVKDTYNEIADLKKQLQDFEDEEDINDVRKQALENQIAINKAKATDTSLSLKARQRLAEESIKYENIIIGINKKSNKDAQDLFLADVILKNKNIKLTGEQVKTLRKFNDEGLALAKDLEDDKVNTLRIDTARYKELVERQEAQKRESAVRLEKNIANRNKRIEAQKALEAKQKEDQDKADAKERDRLAKQTELETQIYLDSIEDSVTLQIEKLQVEYSRKEDEILEFVKDPALQKDLIKQLRENVARQTDAIIEAEEEKLEKLKAARKKEIKELSFDPLTDKTDNGLDDVKAITERNNINKILLDIDKKQKDDELALEKEKQERLAKQVLQSTTDLYSQISDARIQSIDNEINAQEQKIGRFRELAEFGTAEQLQLEEERLNELQIKREREIERNRKIAAAQIAINQAVTISNAISGVVEAFRTDPTGITTILKTVALAATIAGLTASLGSVFGNLPAFKEGVSYVDGPGTETSDSILARLSKGERVLTAKQNRAIGAISNEDLTYYVKLGQSISDIEPQSRAADYTNQFNELVHENRLMRKALNKLKIEMGINKKGVYSMITTMQEDENRKSILKA